VAFGGPVGPTGPSDQATAGDSQRVCDWSTAGGVLVSLMVRTQAAIDATVDTRGAAGGQDYTIRLVYDSGGGVPVAGLGDAAKYQELPNGDEGLFVLSGTTMLDFLAVDLAAPARPEVVEHLASIALQRLPVRQP